MLDDLRDAIYEDDVEGVRDIAMLKGLDDNTFRYACKYLDCLPEGWLDKPGYRKHCVNFLKNMPDGLTQWEMWGFLQKLINKAPVYYVTQAYNGQKNTLRIAYKDDTLMVPPFSVSDGWDRKLEDDVSIYNIEFCEDYFRLRVKGSCTYKAFRRSGYMYYGKNLNELESRLKNSWYRNDAIPLWEAVHAMFP